MKPTPIELEMPMGKDINGAEHREPWKAYDIDEVDALLAEKDAEIAQLQAMLEERNKRVGELKAYIVYTPMDGTAEGLWELDNSGASRPRRCRNTLTYSANASRT